jgi:L-cysteine/cystine lyase
MTSISTDLRPLEPLRQQFPALANNVYFNYGGQGPMPQRAIAAIHHALDYTQQAGPFCNEVNQWITHESKLTREAIATVLQVAPETITLTENVTVGCNIALWGIDWREGDHILLSDCEHPGIIAIVEEVQRRFGVKVSTCPLMATLNEGDPVTVIEQHLRPTTRLVVISHILWNVGKVLPLAEIVTACHRYPSTYATVRVPVDAAQSVGVLPLHLAETNVDFYAFTGHKWLCGPAGVGALYVSPEAGAILKPTFIGWRGITKDAKGSPTGFMNDGQRYEVATSDFILFGALREAIAFHDTWGTEEERFQRIRDLSAYLWQQLKTLPQIDCLSHTPPDAGLIAFQIKSQRPKIHAEVVNRLEKQGYLLRTILDPDCIRACVHYFTLESEIDRLIAALSDLLPQVE